PGSPLVGCPLVSVLLVPSTSLFYTLSLHDALPISCLIRPFGPMVASVRRPRRGVGHTTLRARAVVRGSRFRPLARLSARRCARPDRKSTRSELQSPYDLVCRLLLEKKNTIRPVSRT